MNCIRCGDETWNIICPTCMAKWKEMRYQVFKALESKYGKLTQLNHEIYKKEIKRLENIWRKDINRFQVQLNLLITPPANGQR